MEWFLAGAAFAAGMIVGGSIAVIIMACLTASSDADDELRGVYLETVGSHETNPFQQQEVDDDLG